MKWQNINCRKSFNKYLGKRKHIWAQPGKGRGLNLLCQFLLILNRRFIIMIKSKFKILTTRLISGGKHQELWNKVLRKMGKNSLEHRIVLKKNRKQIHKLEGNQLIHPNRTNQENLGNVPRKTTYPSLLPNLEICQTWCFPSTITKIWAKTKHWISNRVYPQRIKEIIPRRRISTNRNAPYLKDRESVTLQLHLPHRIWWLKIL